MRLPANLLATAAVLVLVIPVIAGLRHTVLEFSAQTASYQDDGRRYVLPSEPEGVEAALRLADRLFVCCATDGAPADLLEQWLETAESLDWSGALQQVSDFSSGLVSQPGSYLLTATPSYTPLLILQADSLFVAGYEPGTGSVLYRRRIVDEFWPGAVLQVSQPVTSWSR